MGSARCRQRDVPVGARLTTPALSAEIRRTHLGFPPKVERLTSLARLEGPPAYANGCDSNRCIETITREICIPGRESRAGRTALRSEAPSGSLRVRSQDRS